MKTLIRNLLPQDTRSVEFPSAVGLIICSIMLFFNIIPQVNNIGFLCLVTLILGVVYIVSLLHFPKLDCCRPLLSWMAGTFWIWLTFSQPISIMAIPVFLMGISNIVAFLINTVILSETWKP